MLTATRNRLAFDTFGGVYSALTEHPLWAEQNKKLADHWGELPANATVFDLGAGTGIGTVALGDVLPADAHVVGVDLMPAMVERAERRLKQTASQRVSFMVADASAMPHVATGSVHAVVANSFLYLVPDPGAVLREVHRILAPGGRVVFMEPRAESAVLPALLEGARHAGVVTRAPSSASRLFAAMSAWRLMSGLVGRRTQAELTTLFVESGFANVRFSPTLGGLGQHVVADR